MFYLFTVKLQVVVNFHDFISREPQEKRDIEEAMGYKAKWYTFYTIVLYFLT